MPSVDWNSQEVLPLNLDYSKRKTVVCFLGYFSSVVASRIVSIHSLNHSFRRLRLPPPSDC